MGKGTGRNSSHHQFFITIRGFKKGLNIAGDVVPGRNIKQAAKSRLKSTGQSLLQKAMDTALLGLPKSGLFPLGRFFYSSLSWGSYRVHSFLE
jgi:hypothetical protein